MVDSHENIFRCYFEMFDDSAQWAIDHLNMRRIPPRKGFALRCGIPLTGMQKYWDKFEDQHVLVILQTGEMQGNLMRRMGGTIRVSFGRLGSWHLSLC